MRRPTENMPPHYLVEHLREALANDGRVNELGLTVKIAGHRIFVTGTVTSADRRDAIPTVIDEVLPGYEVLNETNVSRPAHAEEAEKLS